MSNWKFEECLSLKDAEGRELCYGYLDAYAIIGKEGIIVDWKFGYRLDDKESIFRQLVGQGAALIQTLGLTQVVCYGYWPRHDHFIQVLVSSEQVPQIIADLQDLILASDSADAYAVGPHCEYCRARISCQAFNAQLAIMEREQLPLVDLKRASAICEIAPSVEKLIDQAKAMVREAVGKGEDIRSPSGGRWKFKEVAGNREVCSVQKAFDLFAEAGIAAAPFIGQLDASWGKLETLFVAQIKAKNPKYTKEDLKRLFDAKMKEYGAGKRQPPKRWLVLERSGE